MKIIVCTSFEDAEHIEALALSVVRSQGVICSRYAGVYQCTDGRFGVPWSARLPAFVADGHALENEVLAQDGDRVSSNWAEYVPPTPKEPAP